jgi:hypothetical protein
MLRNIWTTGAVLFALAVATAQGGGTAVWELSSKEHFDKGTMEGVVSYQPGGLRIGPALKKFQLKDEVGVWCTYLSPAGEVFLGTAKGASVYRLETEGPKRLLKTEELAVTDMVMDPAGNLYAATIPNGKIFRIPKKGKEAVFKIPDPYAWKLAFKEDGNLYVASGPKGKVYLLERGGGWVREVLASENEKNIISMALEPGGGLLCGSAENGILYRLRKDGRVEAVHNFPEKEIRDIRIAPGGIYIATNISQKSFKQDKFVGELAAFLQAEARGGTQPGGKKKFKKLLNGKIYRIDPRGRVDRILSLAQNFILALGVAADGSVLAGCGAEGRVIAVDPSRRSYTLVDLEEEQVITLLMKDGKLHAVGTGHPGKLFLVEADPGPKGTYLSDILDTGFPSVFGRLFWEGEGQVSFRTRTGNTKKPDRTWSAWSDPITKSLTPVPSPRARFFQFRIDFGDHPGARVTHVRLFYTRENQRPSVNAVTVGATASSQIKKLGAEKRLAKLVVKTQASDPDGDPLLFRLFYRATGRKEWIPLNEGKPFPKPEYPWDVSDMPDGLYEVRVQASDELVNPHGEALTGERVSAPFVIDNRKPEVADLAADMGEEIILRGKARDDASQITRIEVSVDDEPWAFVYPEDRVYDSREEPFGIVLPALSPGMHRIRVRVRDRAGNTAIAEIEVSVK